MAVTFGDLLESSDLSQEARDMIVEAWDQRLAEAKEELTAELREEFAQRYEHDKAQIAEAVDKFISSKLEAEISELAEEKKSLAEDRVKYKKAIKEHAKLLNKFVSEQLSKEVRELNNDRQAVSAHLDSLNEFVVKQLSEELSEFHSDKVALVEQKVKMVREGKEKLEETRRNFIKRAASTVEKTVNKVISEEIRQYRDDITAARENDFGRRIFESFAQEFSSSYLNENTEVRKVQKEMAALRRELSEAKALVSESQEQQKLVESKLRVAKDRFARKEKLDELLQPLSKAKKELMADLLTNVKTEKLEESFNKYLPSVLDGEKPVREKKPLTESVTKEHTGNKTVQPSQEAEQDVVDLNELRKLAGLSNQEIRNGKFI